MTITRIGLDIAKSVFQLHGVDARGKTVLRKTLARGEVLGFFANRPACLIGIEACAGSHYWARELIKLGHDVRLMAAQFVIPYRKSGKNDATDAEAICEAVGRPNMRFVPVKSEEAQAVLAVHRARALTVSERTALVNQVRGLLGEFGIVASAGIARARKLLSEIGAGARTLPVLARENVRRTARPLAHPRRTHPGLRSQDRGTGATERGRAPAHGNRRHWPGDRLGHCRQRRPGDHLYQRPTLCGVAGAYAASALQRRQDRAGRDQQTR